MVDKSKSEEQARLQMAVIDRIQALMREKQWTIPELAAQSQVSVRTLHYIFQNKNITLHTLACLCRGFGITLGDFFDAQFSQFTEDEDD